METLLSWRSVQDETTNLLNGNYALFRNLLSDMQSFKLLCAAAKNNITCKVRH